MAEVRKKATIRKINRCVQKIRAHHEPERIETVGYEDEMGDDVRATTIHSHGLLTLSGSAEGNRSPEANGTPEENNG